MNSAEDKNQVHNAVKGWWNTPVPSDFEDSMQKHHKGDAGAAVQHYDQMYHAYPPLKEGEGRLVNTLGQPPQKDADVRSAQGKLPEKLSDNKSDDGKLRGYDAPDYRRR
jgi:hypothetical protein